MSHRTNRLQQVVAADTAAAQVAATAVAAADTLAVATAAVMTAALLATAPAVIADLAVATQAATVVATAPVASVRLIAHHVHIPQRQQPMQRRVHLIVPQLIVHVMAKIARLQLSVVTRRRVVILLIVASVQNALLRHVKIAQRVLVLIVLRSLSAVIVVPIVRSVAARATVILVQLGVVQTVPHRAVNMLMPRLRNVANLHRVLSAPTVPVTTTCHFSAQRVWSQRHVVRVPSSRMTIALSAVATSLRAQR